MAAPRPQGNPPPGGMQRNGGASTDIRPYISNLLQSRPIPSGWQETLPMQTRLSLVHQMVTQLLIVKPDMGPLDAAIVAARYEDGEFRRSLDRATYEAALHQKLSDIHQTRQNQAVIQQQQLQNRQPGQMGPAQMGPTQQQMLAQRMAQSQMQQGFGMQQPPQPGQPLPNSTQQQLSQHQQMVQIGNGVEMQQPLQNGQPLQTMNRPMQQYRGPPQISEQENQHIAILAAQMQKNLTPDDLANIQRQVANLPPQQLRNMQVQGINPFHAYLRNQARVKFLEERARRQRAGQGFAPPGVTTIANQGRPTSQVSMRSQGQQAPPASASQHPDQTFALSNMDQIVGQQQDALRHQEAGQTVVPMSNSQGGPPQVRGAPNPQGQHQFNPSRPMQPPNPFQPQNQPFWNNQQNNQQNPAQQSQMQTQPPTPNLAGLQGQTPQLQGQLGGLNNNRGQRTPQQTHNMPTLNKPLDPQGQGQNGQPPRSAQPTPKTNQRTVPGGAQAAGANVQPNSGQQRPQAAPTPQSQWLDKMPPHIRSQLRSLPEDKQKQWLLQMHQRQRQQRMKAAADAQGLANSNAALQSRQQGSVTATQASQAKASNVNPNGSQMSLNPTASINMQSQGAQQQMPPDGMRPTMSKMGAIALNEGQTRHMDTLEFPANLLNRSSDLGKLPDNLRTWGQLKEYVHRNESNLPPSSLQKVISLQSIDFQIRQHQAMSQRKNQSAPQVNSGGAPVGQMMPLQHNQPAPGPTTQAQAPLRFPPIPEATPQEIQALRAKFLAQGRTASDAELRECIMKQRKQQFFKNPQVQQAMAQQQQIQRNHIQRNTEAQQNHVTGTQNDVGQGQQPPRSQGQPPQMGQPRVQPQQQCKQDVQPQKPAPGAWAGVQPDVPKTNQKGLKRNNNDDVIEVPNPRFAQQQGRPPVAKVGQPPPMVNGVPQITREQFASLTNEKKLEFGMRMQAAQAAQAAQRASTAQTGSQPVQAQVPAAGANQTGRPATGRDNRLNQLMAKVVQSTPRRPEIPMSPNTRRQMIDRLRNKTGIMVKRIDQSLPVYLQILKNENHTRELLRIRLLLSQQVRDQHFTVPVENFTMSLAELEQSEAKLHEYFGVMMEKIPQAPNNQPQQLNAANLQQQQEALKVERAASVQKTHNNSSTRVPAAPTTSTAPFPFGSQSPQGVPHFYGPNKNELTQEKLVLPATKRRKGNATSPATTPAETQITPATKPSPLPKTESPEAQRTSVAPATNKCPVIDCESGHAGFSTKADLDRHTSEAHDPTHNIKDPLDAAAYAIESLRIALNLDENGRSKPGTAHEAKGDVSTLQAAAMKTTASSQGVKHEAATPMSRVPTQTGPSPSSTALKTPQAAANTKTPAYEARSVENKSVEKDAAAGTKAQTAIKSTAVIVSDLWANSQVKPEWFKEVFGGVADLNRQVHMDVIANWSERNPLSPSTSPSSGPAPKDSPHSSGISANDDLKIKLTATEDEDWVMADWADDALQGDMASLEIPDFMEMEWEEVFGKEEDDTITSKGRKRDVNEPIGEWLKAWAPEKLEEQKKEAGREA